jgi:septum formation protein
MHRPLILASASASRAQLLRNAGVDFEVMVAPIDEDAIKKRKSELSVDQLARALAQAKAAAVAKQRSDALVIGADQILDCDGQRFDKPKDRAQAAEHLRYLRGRTHRLVTAACAFSGDECVWETLAEPRLVMRDFSDAFLDDYLARAGEGVLGSVGVYHLEGLGAQLFTRVDGDYFSILGLPLLPLLAFLRTQQVVMT